jgi:hypothetical protein
VALRYLDRFRHIVGRRTQPQQGPYQQVQRDGRISGIRLRGTRLTRAQAGLSVPLRVLIVIHCERQDGDVIRLISARKADPQERQLYAARRA